MPTTKSRTRTSARRRPGTTQQHDPPSPREHPFQWLSDQARNGLKDLPANASWLLSRALEPAEAAGDAAESAAADTRDRARKVKASVKDAVPGGDSVEERMKRAREAAERAQDAEAEAVEAAREAKERSERAKEVGEQGRQARGGGQAGERGQRRGPRGRGPAGGRPRRWPPSAPRRSADAEAEVRRGGAGRPARQAEAAQQEAEEAQAQRQGSRWRRPTSGWPRPGGWPTRPARPRARPPRQAQRQAEQLAADADEQRRQADAKVEAAEAVRQRADTDAKTTTRKIKREQVNGDLKERTKPELLDLAAAVEVEGRTTMTKAELVKAIDKESAR